ncbi:hypothetical protein OIU79_022956 [Salix purpurea]|uniref:Uncharacterized protein n=1 Tax=Salix purpurea TaxID=77065 RepID=A0A9Q0WHZ1_SALPP|nr:hypothetical protein OIU79_022956 [Salix purpurea]
MLSCASTFYACKGHKKKNQAMAWKNILVRSHSKNERGGEMDTPIKNLELWSESLLGIKHGRFGKMFDL